MKICPPRYDASFHPSKFHYFQIGWQHVSVNEVFKQQVYVMNGKHLCKIGPIRLALVGLMAGWQAGSPADEKVAVLEIFKIQ